MARHDKGASHPQLKPTLTLDTALNELYQGRTNVAIQAARVGMSKTELQQVFRDYVSSRGGFTPDAWQKDDEVSWPYIT